MPRLCDHERPKRSIVKQLWADAWAWQSAAIFGVAWFVIHRALAWLNAVNPTAAFFVYHVDKFLVPPQWNGPLWVNLCISWFVTAWTLAVPALLVAYARQHKRQIQMLDAYDSALADLKQVQHDLSREKSYRVLQICPECQKELGPA